MDMNNNRFAYTTLMSALALLAIHVAYAAVVPSAPSADPGRIVQRTLTPPPVKTEDRQQEVSMVQSKRSVVGEFKPFVVRHVSIVGIASFGEGELNSFYAGLVGKRVNSDTLYAVANKITEYYLAAGYPLVTTHVTIKRGTVTFHVNEGRVGRIIIEGVMNPSTAQYLQGLGDKLKMASPVTMRALERYALLANDTPGMTVRTIVRPSVTNADEMDIVFWGCYKPFDAYASFDNRGTKILGPEEWLGGAFANSWWGGNRTGIEALVTHDLRQERYLSFMHQQFIGSEGMNLYLNLQHVETRPGGDYFDVGTRGLSNEGSLTLSYPLIRSRQHSLFVHGTFDALNNRVNEREISYLLFDDKIRSARLGATYDFNDKWKASNTLDVEVSQGINGLGAGAETPSTVDGELDYTKVTASFDRTQYLSTNLSYALGLRGQYSRDSLLSSEQFGFGGPVYGRGYDPSEILGDYGLAGKLELRYEWYPCLSPNYNYFNYVQWYVLYDAGKVWNHTDDTLNGVYFNEGEASATSAGVGVRFDIVPKFLTGNLEVDKPLTRKVFLEDDRDARLYFGLTATL